MMDRSIANIWASAATRLAFAFALSVAQSAVVSSVYAQAPPSRAEAQAQRRVAEGNLVGHGGPVKAIAVSADGTRALTGSFDYSAMLWDVSGVIPKQLLRLADHNGAVNAVAFVPGTSRAVTAGDDSVVRLWDLATGKLLHKFEGHDAGSKIVGLNVSADGRFVASAGWDRTARLWDLEARAAGPILKDHTKPVNATAFSLDGSHLLTASADGTVGYWRVKDGQFIRPLIRLGWGVNALSRIDGTDRFVAGVLDGSVHLIDPGAETSRSLKGHDRPILAVSTLAKPGLIATSGGDGVVRLMRAEDGSIIEEYKNPFGPVWALAIRPVTEGQPIGAYYGGLDDFVTLWQASPRKPFEPVDASNYPRRFQQTAKSDDPIAKGEIQFARKCSICHTLTPDGANRAGPTLHGVFGRRIASLPGYNFSPELKTLDIVWSAETIAKLFELGPDKFTPGSKMPLQVMSDKIERDALIVFLEAATK